MIHPRLVLMRALALVLVVLVLLAGCASKEDPAPDEPQGTSPTPVSTTATSAMAAGNATEDGGPLVIVRPVPFAFDGNTGSWTCAPSGPGSCEVVLAAPPTNTFLLPEYEGDPRAVTLTMTWEAATPAPTPSEMHVTVFATRSCGEGCIEESEGGFSATASGPSPLLLEAFGVELAEGETLAVRVGAVSPTPEPPVTFFYSSDQAFHVEGTIAAATPYAP